jgi:hypothetical protein
MLENAIRAARLDVDFYNTVESDETYTQQAALLVVVVHALVGLGNAFVYRGFVWPIVWSIIVGVVGWLLWSWITDVVGRNVFGGQTNFGEMQRVLGYSQAPLALGVIPFLGWVGAIWALIAAVVAIREGQDFTTGKAIGTVIVGWLVWFIASGILYAIFN